MLVERHSPRYVFRILVLTVLLHGCTGTTGSDVVHFTAYASGISDESSETLTFTSGRKYSVVLSEATLHVGALYLNQNRPISGSGETSCILPGTYVAEVREGLTINVLSTQRQFFPSIGDGTATLAESAEVWLFGTTYDAQDDSTVIVDVAGVASKDKVDYPFKGTFTIGKNRIVSPVDPSLPGSNPICKQRIISPIPTDILPQDGGVLSLLIDPREWFGNVDFASLPLGTDGVRVFQDTPDNTASQALFDGVKSASSYQFFWVTQ